MDQKAPVSGSWQTTEAQVRAWVQAVLRTALIRSARRQSRVRMYEALRSWKEEGASWQTEAIDNEQRWVDRIDFAEVVRDLNARERTVVHGLLQGESEATIAVTLHVTPRTVRRIRAQLRDRFRRPPHSWT